jgi:stringent starvation protein B
VCLRAPLASAHTAAPTRAKTRGERLADSNGVGRLLLGVRAVVRLFGQEMPDAPRPLPPKKEVALALLEGPSLFVHLDPRREGVLVPKWFVSQPQLVLQVGLNMAIPIHDLKVDDDGVSCTLSFSRTPFWCRLPWSAVYALVGEDGRGMVWPQDVPPEVATQMQKQQAATSKASAKKAKPKLNAVVDGDGSGEREGNARPSKRTRDESKSESAKESKRSEGTLRGIGPRAAFGAESERERVAAGPAPEAVRDQETAAGRASSPSNPDDAPASDRPGPTAKKPKRELPPYLRVIK